MPFDGPKKALLLTPRVDGLNLVAVPRLPPLATFARSGTNATYFDSAGVLQSAAANAARFDRDPLAFDPRGLLIETKANVNQIRGKIGTSGVAGTTTLPTGQSGGNSGGLATWFQGTYVERGITMVQYRTFGTTTGTATQAINLELSNHISATVGAVRCHGGFLRHELLKPDRVTATGSSFNGVSGICWALSEYNSTPTFLSPSQFGPAIGLSDTDIIWFEAPFTMAQATANFDRPLFSFVTTGTGTVVDFSFAIGIPTDVSGAFCGSPIAPSALDDTRGADSLLIPSRRPLTASGAFIFEYAPMSFAGALLFQIDDGTDNNRVYFQHDTAGTTLGWGAYVSGVQTAGTGVSAGAFMRGEPTRIALTWGKGSMSAKTAGNAAETLAVLPSFNRIRVGQNVAGTGTGALYLRGYEIQPRTQSGGWLNAATAV